MSLHPKKLLLLTFILTSSLLAQLTTAPKVDASAPIPKRANARFYELHAEFLKRSKEPMDILFLGDSITEGWRQAPDVWQKYYGQWRPANYGIGGDQTHHVIWRIEDGELDGVNPKVVVLMIGTNNSLRHTGEEIAAANRRIVELIQQKIPGVKILILAIFPRGPRPNLQPGQVDDSPTRIATINEANQLLAKLENGSAVRFLDIGDAFLDPNGKIPMDVMPDQLHPNQKGYQIWADAMQPTLEDMMK